MKSRPPYQRVDAVSEQVSHGWRLDIADLEARLGQQVVEQSKDAHLGIIVQRADLDAVVLFFSTASIVAARKETLSRPAATRTARRYALGSSRSVIVNVKSTLP